MNYNAKFHSIFRTICCFSLYLTSIVCNLIPMTSAFFNEVTFVEPEYYSYEQLHPHMAYDQNGDLHMVWQDDRDQAPNHIYHRILYHSLMFNSSMRADRLTTCEIVDCDLDFPKIVLDFLDPSIGFMICSSGANPNYQLPSAAMMLSGTPPNPTWASIPPPISGGDSYRDFAIASKEKDIIAAWVAQGTIHLQHYDTVTQQWDSPLSMINPPSDTILWNVDIAMDDAGFIYIVCDSTNNQTSRSSVLACRSFLPFDVQSGFNEFRQVPDIQSYVLPSGNPSIDVKTIRGNVIVAISYTERVYVIDNINLACRCEINGDWINSSQMMGNRRIINDYTGTGYSIGESDVAIGPDGQILVVWSDNRPNLMPESRIYKAISYNYGNSYTEDELVSPRLSSSAAEYPVAAWSPINADYAIGYQKKVMLNYHVFAVVNQADFLDRCDSSPLNFWDVAQGVVLDNSIFHDPGLFGSSYRIQNSQTKGELVYDLGTDSAYGSVDLWFYDGLSTDTDFYVSLNGDDGTKAGIFRMLGVRNDISDSNYSINNGSSWIATMRPRTLNWHHLIMSVSEDGIEILLDPESVPLPVYVDLVFDNFSKVEIQGGSDTDPYNVDDIRVTTDLIPPSPVAIPALNTWGFMILSFGMIMLLWRKCH